LKTNLKKTIIHYSQLNERINFEAMKNTIAERVYDFLKNYPPFKMLSKELLTTISENVKILYFETETKIFEIDEPVGDNFYIVKDGAVGIYSGTKNGLADKCGEGDIFGLRALIRKDKYQLTAITHEESIIYSISLDLLQEIMQTSQEAKEFIITSFATDNNSNTKQDSVLDKLFANEKNSFTEVQAVQYSENTITCSISTSIQEAALLMSQHKVGSIIITKNEKPIGIITDKDLRFKIATGKFGIDQKVDKIMSSPVITSAKEISIAEAQMSMLKCNIAHLCITQDGTPDSKLIGILSEHDIVLSYGNNPSVLIKEIKRSKETAILKSVRQKAEQLLKAYLEQNVDILFIANVLSHINDAITKQLIELSIDEMNEKPPVNFAWLSLGSMGRNEQFLLTDQDNALVFDDVAENEYTKTKDYFISLSHKINDKLNQIGFEYCPADVMARNPKWCLSLSQWNNQFKQWIVSPTNEKVMLCTIFFDYRLVYGKHELVSQMTQSIFKSIDGFEIFLNFLALNATQNPPPLSFFRNFLVEAGGEHKNQFDIKARAIMPLVDAARLLILSHHVGNCNNTILRYQRLVKLEPQNAELFEECIESYKKLLHFRSLQGIRNNDSGRYVDLNSLSKSDKLQLRSSFKPIKDIQELISVRFRLSHLR